MEAILKWLQTTLATILDKLKASNPVLYAVLAFILGVIMYILETGIASGIIPNSELLNTLKAIVFTLAVLLGSRTSNFLPASKKKSE